VRTLLGLGGLVFLAFAVCIAATDADAFEETVIQFRSLDDPAVPPDRAVCDNAPDSFPKFSALVILGASLWTSKTDEADGTVIDETVHQIGTAQACMWITLLALGAQAPFYIEFYLGDLTVRSSGRCIVMSRNIPAAGLLLGGCALAVHGEPVSGLLGGVATSNSVFNPFHLPGFRTGSFWTVHMYSE